MFLVGPKDKIGPHLFYPFPVCNSTSQSRIFSCLFSTAFESKPFCQGEAKLCFPTPTNPPLPNSGFLRIILDWIGEADNVLTQEVGGGGENGWVTCWKNGQNRKGY